MSEGEGDVRVPSELLATHLSYHLAYGAAAGATYKARQTALEEV